jgi:hypothetical protein
MSYFGLDIANPLAYRAIFAYENFCASARQVIATMTGAQDLATMILSGSAFHVIRLRPAALKAAMKRGQRTVRGSWDDAAASKSR